MTVKLIAVVALGVLVGFLGILWWWVPRLDLGAVIAITLLLAGWDLLSGFVRKPGAR
jgi:hypothetical protein